MKQKRFSEERIIKILREAEVPGAAGHDDLGAADLRLTLAASQPAHFRINRSRTASARSRSRLGPVPAPDWPADAR